MDPSRIQAVDHVEMEAPPVAKEALRWFYGELLELDERPCETTGSERLCFKSERIELRIRLIDSAHIDGGFVRVTVAVDSVDGAAAVLDERRVPYQIIQGFRHSDRRLQVLDPAGNRVELKQGWRTGVF